MAKKRRGEVLRPPGQLLCLLLAPRLRWQWHGWRLQQMRLRLLQLRLLQLRLLQVRLPQLRHWRCR